MPELYEFRGSEGNWRRLPGDLRRDAPRVTPPTTALFAAAGVAFLACGLGLLIHHILSGIFMVMGTAVMGLLYLAIGIWRLAHAVPEKIADTETDTMSDGAYGHQVSLVTEPAGFRAAASPVRRRSAEAREITATAPRESITQPRRC